jgi:hypothetical protein
MGNTNPLTAGVQNDPSKVVPTVIIANSTPEIFSIFAEFDLTEPAKKAGKTNFTPLAEFGNTKIDWPKTTTKGAFSLKVVEPKPAGQTGGESSTVEFRDDLAKLKTQIDTMTTPVPLAAVWLEPVKIEAVGSKKDLAVELYRSMDKADSGDCTVTYIVRGATGEAK